MYLIAQRWDTLLIVISILLVHYRLAKKAIAI